jgi:hypothetical protein
MRNALMLDWYFVGFRSTTTWTAMHMHQSVAHALSARCGCWDVRLTAEKMKVYGWLLCRIRQCG